MVDLHHPQGNRGPEMTTRPRVLVVDDQWGHPNDPMLESRYGSIPVVWLKETGWDGSQYSVERVLRRVQDEAQELACVLLDVCFGPDMEYLGPDILERIRSQFPTLPIVMLTGLDHRGYRELVIKCLELGANEYIVKAPTCADLENSIAAYSPDGLSTPLFGNSPRVRLLRATIARISFAGTSSVFIMGESGSGKELVARMIHRTGPRAKRPFVAKNCADADLNLLDSELFGHERGAFTGASARRIGIFEESDGGVLFLDEIAGMPLELQGKLLRVLETRTFRRLGGTDEIKSDFQLVCASNQAAEALIERRLLREDFYYRIAPLTISVPPLRERREDISCLAEFFLKRFRARDGEGYPGTSFGSACLLALTRYYWPGNVRQLRNAVQHAAIMSRTSQIDQCSLPSYISDFVLSRSGITDGRDSDVLPEDMNSWAGHRIICELRMILEAKRRIKRSKGERWKAELIRHLYPNSKTANAKAFSDLISRLSDGAWGIGKQKDSEIEKLFRELLD